MTLPSDRDDNNTEEPADRGCENCGRWIDTRETLYHVKLEIYAEKTIDLTPSLEDSKSPSQSLEEMIHLLANMNEDEVREATNQVYEKFTFNLCKHCRSELHKRIQQRKNLLTS